MSRFARISEEAYRRRKELADKARNQGYQETFLLYQLIVMHSWATGICDKEIDQLCELYDLEYHNTTRRAKILREKKWLADTTKFLRPLILHRPDVKEKSSVNSTPENNVNFTPDDDSGSVKFTPEKPAKSVKITPDKCKIYTENDLNSVNFTPENAATSDEISDSGDAKTFKDLKNPFMTSAAKEKTAAAAVETNGHKSIFSIEECLSYAEICARRGDPIKSIEALAKHSHKTGEMDAFISATLYPEAIIPEQTVEYDDAPGGNLNAKEFDDALKLLIETQADGFDVSGWEKFYTLEDWARLQEEAKSYK